MQVTSTQDKSHCHKNSKPNTQPKMPSAQKSITTFMNTQRQENNTHGWGGEENNKRNKHENHKKKSQKISNKGSKLSIINMFKDLKENINTR